MDRERRDPADHTAAHRAAGRQRVAAFLPTIDGDAPKRALRCRVAVASTLFAALELARNGVLAVEQDADWQPIRVTSRANGEPVADDRAPPG